MKKALTLSYGGVIFIQKDKESIEMYTEEEKTKYNKIAKEIGASLIFLGEYIFIRLENGNTLRLDRVSLIRFYSNELRKRQEKEKNQRKKKLKEHRDNK